MDEIPQCVTFYEFIDDLNNSIDDKNHAYSNIYYQLIYLFLIIGVINFDMHRDNALVYRDNGTIKTELIDFGWCDNLTTTEKDSEYLKIYEKNYINTIREKLKDELNNIIFSKTRTQENQSKINFIMKTMNILNIICWTSNRRERNIINKTQHQINWFEPIPEVTQFMHDTENVFNTNDDDDEGVQYETIDETDRVGILIKYLMEKDDYINTYGIPLKAFDLLKSNFMTNSTAYNSYTIPPIEEKGSDSTAYNSYTISPIEEKGSDCTLSGGKKTRKTKRKYNTKSCIKSGKKTCKSKRKTQRKSGIKSKRAVVK